jgi:hypothetical protein
VESVDKQLSILVGFSSLGGIVLQQLLRNMLAISHQATLHLLQNLNDFLNIALANEF